MAEQPDIAEVIRNIQADVTTIVKGELELAKAELMPQAKAAGIGAGLFGGAAYFGLTGAMLLFCGLSFWMSLCFQDWFALDLLAALAWGFATIAVVFFLIAGVLALIGKGRMEQVSGPEVTVASAEASVAAVKGAVEQGLQDVAGRSLSGKRPELEA